MSKGSGTTRSESAGGSSRSSAVSSLSASQRNAEINRTVSEIRKTAFKSDMGGIWNLETPNADASISLVDDPYAGRVYEVSIIGAYNKDGKYESMTPSQNRYATLNAAKEGARADLEEYYRKRNK